MRPGIDLVVTGPMPEHDVVWSATGSPHALRSVRVRINGARLTPSERRIADVMLEGYPHAALLTGRLIADKAQASPASVSRFAIKLGYRNLAEMQDLLKSELRARIPSPTGRLELDSQRFHRSQRALFEAAIDIDIQNLRRTLAQTDERDFADLVHRLRRRSGTVYVAGSKKAGVVARYFAIQLGQIRPKVRLLILSDTLADQVLDMSPGDLLVVFEPRRATQTIVRLVEHARRSDTIVAVFSDENPPAVLASADFVFAAPIDSISVFDSYVGLFALCDGILAALVQLNPKAMTTRANRLEAANQALVSWHESSDRH